MRRACHPPSAQRGITLIGLLLWAIVVAFVALIVVRVVPTVNEYSTILRAVQKIAKDAPSTVAEARAAFERQKEIEYSIQSISGKGNATLDTVGPHIAEALFATAIGLVAAVPAVMAYNYFVRRIRVLRSEMDTFEQDYLNIIKRHFLH